MVIPKFKPKVRDFYGRSTELQTRDTQLQTKNTGLLWQNYGAPNPRHPAPNQNYRAPNPRHPAPNQKYRASNQRHPAPNQKYGTSAAELRSSKPEVRRSGSEARQSKPDVPILHSFFTSTESQDTATLSGVVPAEIRCLFAISTTPWRLTTCLPARSRPTTAPPALRRLDNDDF